MKRLTTDNPEGNFETALNFVYGKDGVAYLRSDGERDDVPVHEWARKQCIERGCDEFPGETLEEIDEAICACGFDFPDCPVHLAYTFACQAVHLRGRLKMYEDTWLMPDDITNLMAAHGTAIEKLAEYRTREEKRAPKCYSEDVGGGCRYLVPDGDDEPLAKCKRCLLCYADKRRHQLPPNAPLTLEELREMDGEPVWCVSDCGDGHWMIVHVYGDAPEQVECIFRPNYVWDGRKYRMRGGFGWRAYRRKPEKV